MSDRDQSPSGAGGNNDEQPKSEHLNIKVTDNNNEVFFKIKRTTALSKLMNAFCDRQGKNLQSVRFLFDGSRVNPSDSPESVGFYLRINSVLPIFLKITIVACALTLFSNNFSKFTRLTC